MAFGKKNQDEEAERRVEAVAADEWLKRAERIAWPAAAA
jgi:hypothetical protein